MRKFGFALVILLSGCMPYTGHDQDMEFQRALAVAYKARVEGPATVSIAGRTTLRVQSGQAWIPRAQAAPLLSAIGVEQRPDMLGLLVNAVRLPTMAIVYATDRRVPELPGIGVAGWRDAPDLAGFRPR